MSVDMRERVRSGSAWIRLLFMLLYFVVVFEIVLLLTGLSALFIFVARLVTGEDPDRLRNFSADLNAFTFSALQYVTFNSDQRPFPFSDWPAPEDKKEN
ncbi:DUF4389 domain-containing protein [Arenicellales bacterium IMCC56312]